MRGFARNLRPLLREQVAEEDEIDLSNVAMTHYRLSKLRQQDEHFDRIQAVWGVGYRFD